MLIECKYIIIRKPSFPKIMLIVLRLLKSDTRKSKNKVQPHIIFVILDSRLWCVYHR